jgi:hypothetical protein
MRKQIGIAILCALAFSGLGLSQRNQPPAKPSFPEVIVAKQFLGQTSTIPTTTIFTPKKTALYRVSLYMINTVAGNQPGSVWTGAIGYTDDAGTFGETLFYLGANYLGNSNEYAAPPTQPALTFRANAGTPVTLTVNASGDTSGSVYEVFITVEELT